jgi:hypothetical protein
MDEKMLLRYVRGLKRARVVIAPGLKAAEVEAVEAEYGFRFPPDLRGFLMYALPISDGFIDWRRAPREHILDRLEWPLRGMCFDITHSGFWLDEWGARPADDAAAYAIAKAAVAAAPRLIPVSGHRYIPADPHESGNPVFSVYQTDIIYYGRDLWDYFEHEFAEAFGRPEDTYREPLKTIPFWDALVTLNSQMDPAGMAAYAELAKLSIEEKLRMLAELRRKN